jgi:multidrug efflux pump subunit AcrA (membrane-fusion protein)
MGCVLLLIAVVLFFVFPPAGILMFFVTVVLMLIQSNLSSQQVAASNREMKRIALLSASPEVQAAEAQRARCQRQGKLYAALGLGSIFLVIYILISTGSHSTSPTSATLAPTPVEQITRNSTPVMQTTPEQEPTSVEVTRPIPIVASPTPHSAQLDLQDAEEDLNHAWKSLTEKQRSQLREEEQNWGKRKDALPLDDRIKSTQQRAKYLWSLVERTFDD